MRRNIMNNISKLMAYSFGLGKGFYQADDLEQFLDSVIASEENPPYIFIDVLLNISKSAAELADCIDDNLRDMGYDASVARWDEAEEIKQMLLRQVGVKYRDGSFDLKRTTHELYMLGLTFEDYTRDYLYFDDLWNWVEIGTESEDSVRKPVEEFFDKLDNIS